MNETEVKKIIVDVLLASKRARKEVAEGYTMNLWMGIEAKLLDGEIEALEKMKV